MRTLPLVAVLLAAGGAALADEGRTTDALDAAGRKQGSVTVTRSGDAWTADGKTFTPFTVIVRNTAGAKAAYFGRIALDDGKAGDCTWFAVVDAGATRRLEKPCKQRRAWSDFSVNAKVEVPRAKPAASPTPTPAPEPFVP